MDRARRRAAALLAALAVGIAANVSLAISDAYLVAMRRSIEASLPSSPEFGRTVLAFADLGRTIGVVMGLAAIGALLLVAVGVWRGWRWARIGAMVTALVGAYAGAYTWFSYVEAPVGLAVPLPALIWLPQPTAVIASAIALVLATSACLGVLVTLARAPGAS